MDAPSRAHALRLVGADDPVAAQSLREARARREAARDIERANRESAELTADDARIIFAMRVFESLEGGRAAILRPERRARLRHLAASLGIGEFDTALVMAIAQDAARRGESLESDRAKGALRLVRPARPRPDTDILLRITGALLLGAVLLIVLVRWVLK
jgi:hypothetical protein